MLLNSKVPSSPRKSCFRHIRTQKTTYAEHAGHALSLACHSFVTSIIFFCHAIYPDCFVKTGSSRVKELHEQMKGDRYGSSGSSSDEEDV